MNDADRKILEQAVTRFEDCEERTSELYEAYDEDLAFVEGEGQWEDALIAERKGRPCLIENRVAGMVHQVCNSMRQNRPEMRVVPKDADSTTDTADIISGLLRFIQKDSGSSAAIDTAVDCQVRGGIGYLRVATFVPEGAFDEQDIKIMRITNPRTVKFPFHLCMETDYSDAPYCFIETRMLKEDFLREYPKVDMLEFSEQTREGWVSDKDIRITEYFEIEKEEYDLYRGEDGTISEQPPVEGYYDTRKAYRKKVKWYKLMATAILDRGVFPGDRIPVTPVVGDEFLIEGELRLKSLVRDAKDPQRMLNYWRSATAEKVALVPKSPYIMYEGQDEGFESEWNEAHIRNIPVLHVRVMSENGTVLPIPQRTAPIPMDTAIVSATSEAIDAIKACTGIYDAALGNRSNERSGKAIMARQRESDTSNYHFADNVTRALRALCKTIVNMIPQVYDTPRTLRILGEEYKELLVSVNGPSVDGKLYDLRTGHYDVFAETGPSYASRQQETLSSISELGQNDPQLIVGMRDLLLKYLNLPAEVVERAKKMVPPELKEDKDKPEIPPGVQQQMQQAQALIQQLDTVVQELTKENEKLTIQVANKEGDLQVKMQIAELQAKVDIMVAELKASMEVKKMQHEVGLHAADRAAPNKSSETNRGPSEP